MNNKLSRRGVLGGIAATAVIGFSPTRGWAVAGSESRPRDLSPVPVLDGRLETAPAAVGDFSEDFGKLKGGTPWAVLRPGSVDDIVKMVDYARANKLKIAMNGRAGTGADLESHSCYGQAAVPGGIAIDARGLSKIISVSKGSAVVEAGATWAELTHAAAASGQTPPALTDYLHLSVGGTLSIGGIGGTVQKYGLQTDQVISLDIVTGTGKLLTASRSKRPDLFDAALGGGGQVGIIVRAKLKLVPAPQRAVVFSLFYGDLATYLADAEKVMADGRFQVQAGELLRKPDDSGWNYKLEAAAYYSGTTAPDRAKLLAGLRDDRSRAVIEDGTYLDYMFRLDPYETYLKETGHWQTPKPWLSLFLPANKTAEFMRHVESVLTPGMLGAGFLLFYPYLTSKVTRPLTVQPSGSVGYLFDLLSFPDPGVTKAEIDAILALNRRLYDKAVALGAKRYLVGAIPGMGKAEWCRHFGRSWDAFQDAKKRYDPANILTPGQGFFS
ncbi:FAD-binding protein [Streptomyces sp. ODS05-4]|uniref:FAD-binding protein n=1 Tax=Streptomyces sp. ODS05-4 TaxID=2944939 RepID=UPI002108E08E|nr:FAD-binding protein [Streptomyces sp. ODS05-4]